MNKKLFLHSQTSNHWINSNFQSYFPSVYFKIFFQIYIYNNSTDSNCVDKYLQRTNQKLQSNQKGMLKSRPNQLTTDKQNSSIQCITTLSN